MRLNLIGINVKHGPDFLINRPEGSGDFLFIIFKTEAKVMSDEGWVYAKPDSCILFSKGERQYYTRVNDTYVNHYVHFDTDGGLSPDKAGIPLNVPFELRNVMEIENIIRLLAREQISKYETRSENADFLLRLLINKIAENRMTDPEDIYENRHMDELVSLRTDIYSNAGKYSSVGEMAKAVTLSLSHFQALYSTVFDVSAYDDLTNAKITAAQGYLMNSVMSIREIAQLCGYSSDTAFMRTFKKRTGTTPTEFRNRNRQ